MAAIHGDELIPGDAYQGVDGIHQLIQLLDRTLRVAAASFKSEMSDWWVH
jgi:hypothetical protein